jgi:ABC-2 type transport system permease protein
MSDLYIFKNALKDLTRPRRLLVALFLVALPALIVLLWRANAPKGDFKPEVVYNTIESGLVFGFLLVILAVVNGTGVLSQEIEQKTITYLLTRPVPRWRILLMKFLAAFAAVTVTVWLASLLTAVCAYGGSGLTGSRLGRDMLILPIGALAYGGLFLLLATLFNRPLMYGLLFAFGWESWVPNLPGYFSRVSLMSYLRTLAPHPEPGTESASLEQAASLLDPNIISPSLAWTALIVSSFVALSLALITFSNREYVPRDDAE